MRTIRQNQPVLFDEQGRMIIVQKVIAGDGPETYLGSAEAENGGQSLQLRFVVAGDSIEQAFDNFDAARDAKIEQLNKMQRQASLLV